MMTHEEVRPLLDAYVDGELDSDQARRVEAHLSICSECRDALTNLGILLDQASALRDLAVLPKSDLWSGVLERISTLDDSPAPRGSAEPHRANRPPGRTRVVSARWGSALLGDLVPLWRRPLAWGVIALVLVAGAYTAHVWKRAQTIPAASGVGGPTDSAVAGLATVMAETDHARGDLDAVLQAGGRNWPPNAGPVFERNLQMLDVAIRESRAALEANPQDRGRQRSLLAIYQKELDLLRWATRLLRQT
jgi:anti-sigma factor RsiW